MQVYAKSSEMERSDILRGLRLDGGSPKTLTGQIEDGIRGLIAGGAYAPGDSLPARDVIAKSLGVSECVVRAALRRLAADGIVVSRPRIGCVVQKRPVAARRTVLDVHIDPWTSFGPSNSMFQCSKVLRAEGCRVAMLPLGGGGDRPFLVPLKDALAENPGLVILRSAFTSLKNAMRLVAESGCAFATVGTETKKSRYSRHVGVAHCDYAPAIKAFVADCRAIGLKRVIQLDFGGHPYLDASSALERAEIPCERIALQVNGPADLDTIVQGAYSTMKRFLQKKVLPDLFFFTDDYLALGAFEALRDVGVSVPRDVRVVSFSNSRSGLSPYGNVARINSDPFANGREIAKCILDWFATGDFGTYRGCYSYIRGASFPVA